ncbi:hypothetical protein C4M97_02965 [Mycoplasmopsis pullorum]|uniref:DUF2130 domain-containing protein n=1 Tax=Mycoplasmopsis pullorum TaxID=48003 RepID=UPI00111813EF|nr:DUF2130 domain-containing protein [Mycoplasmopsis pullorum]TNK82541.1 hypothetical protein C4M94_00615 [Mycoplasmopsis pullorum]TNK83323.1 hypothetical protein C4M80_00715 [Mycoplasmopsis pullorum]TNK84490.1 hypothetical protein C4M81_02120 [Mycoplasmopsis pullorum]TNK84733.1 hypothetical protein C4M92_02965 [Mycoplasmopsis pullorum]TNK86323.1 hypothetical protein C4M85_00450 [Mycoplasmopsis pullorum]
MSKKISISVKDPKKLIFIIEEDAKQGDYIDLNDLNTLDFSFFLEHVELIKEQKYREELKNKEQQWKEINESQMRALKLEVEQAKNSEIQDLENQIFELQNKWAIELKNKETQKDIEIEKLKSEIQNLNQVKQSEIEKQILQNNVENNLKLANLQNKISLLEEQHKSELEKQLLQLQNEKKLLSDSLESQINQLKRTKEQDVELAVNRKIQELQKVQKIEIEKQFDQILKNNEQQIEYLKDEKNKLEEKYNAQLIKRSSYTTKDYGEDFENQIVYEVQSFIAPLGEGSPYRIQKINKTTDGEKLDFAINYFYDKKNIGSIVIEAKSRISQKGSTKNADWLDKIEKQRIKNQHEYALLVTELDPEKNFLVETDINYPNIFIVRPEVMMQIIGLLYNITLKKYMLKSDEMNFLEKEEILREFNSFKDDLLKTASEKINSKISGLLKEANSIQNSVNRINEFIEDIQKAINSTLINKINKFSIRKRVIDKIENIENDRKNQEFILIEEENKKLL